MMATKPTKRKRVAPRKKKTTPASNKPSRHPWQRKDGEIHRAGYKIGYARVSTLDQSVALQETALNEAGCERIYTEQRAEGVERVEAPVEAEREFIEVGL